MLINGNKIHCNIQRNKIDDRNLLTILTTKKVVTNKLVNAHEIPPPINPNLFIVRNRHGNKINRLITPICKFIRT